MKTKKIKFPVFLVVLVLVTLFTTASVFAYGFGDNWKYNWCTKCGKQFKHVGIDYSFGAGKKVTFIADMKFRKKGSDGDWKEYLIAESWDGKFTYVVWHLSGIPNFTVGQSLNGKFIGNVADLTVTSDHLHLGYRGAPYNSFISQRGALPACSCGSKYYKYSVGGTLPIYREYFDVPYMKVKVG
jgi:hypothetical protein